jgi:hypothetical protein
MILPGNENNQLMNWNVPTIINTTMKKLISTDIVFIRYSYPYPYKSNSGKSRYQIQS